MVNVSNCWEFKKCGKEGTCPAYPKHGRDCWYVTGTSCFGEIEGLAQKIKDCVTCDFYLMVCKQNNYLTH